LQGLGTDGSFAQVNSYDVTLTMKDKLGLTTAVTRNVGAAAALIHIRADRTGIGFGKFSDAGAAGQNLFDFGRPVRFRQPVTFDNASNVFGGVRFVMVPYNHATAAVAYLERWTIINSDYNTALFTPWTLAGLTGCVNGVKVAKAGWYAVSFGFYIASSAGTQRAVCGSYTEALATATKSAWPVQRTDSVDSVCVHQPGQGSAYCAGTIWANAGNVIVCYGTSGTAGTPSGNDQQFSIAKVG